MSSSESQNINYRLIHCEGVSAGLKAVLSIGKWRRSKKVGDLPFKGANSSFKTKEYVSLFCVQTADL